MHRPGRLRGLRGLAIVGSLVLAIPLLALLLLVARYHLDLRSASRAMLRSSAGITVDPERLKDAPYARARMLGRVESLSLDELSGLAASRRRDDLLWGVNDSGDGPMLYALGSDGRDRGSVLVRDAINVDWEDLAAFELGGEPYLLIGDVGDNFAWRPAITLYVVPEPELRGQRFAPNTKVVPKWILRVRYPDGAEDCEAVAVDVQAKQILLLQKRVVPPVLFAVDLVPRHDDPREVEHVLVARRLGTVPGIPQPTQDEWPAAMDISEWPTAMDISPDGRRAVVFTCEHGYLFDRALGESWAAAFSRLPQRIEAPRLKALEAAAFARDGHTLYVSSELRSAPIYRLEATNVVAGAAGQPAN